MTAFFYRCSDGLGVTVNQVRIEKQLYELSVEDLDRHTVWGFALDEEGEDGQDEATVRPCAIQGDLDPSEGMFIVRARLTLADGTSFRGYLTPPVQGDSSLGTIHPAVVTPRGQVSFWCGTITPSPSQIAESYARLASPVFPLRFESAVPIAGDPIRGEIPGFIVLEDFRTMRTRVVV